MPPPRDGNQDIPFKELMALEKIDQRTFRSIATPFSPGSFGRAYGGHVYAQAVWAAAQTVAKGFTVHNVTGWFILGGLTNVPFVYTVKPIRDGRSYTTRIVHVTQAEGKGICFTCTISFKSREASPLDFQAPIDIWEQYAAALRGTTEASHPVAPGADIPSYTTRMAATGFNEPMLGLDARKVEMGAYNTPLTPQDRRQLHFYRLRGDDTGEDINLHACAHIYATDLNSLYVVANHLGVGDRFTQIGSLMHSVVLHAPQPEDLLMTQGGERVWFAKEDWTTRAAGGRGMHHCRLIAPGGKHIVTSWQEGMVRLGKDEAAQSAAMLKLGRYAKM